MEDLRALASWNLRLAIGRIWILAAATLIACSPSPLVPSPANPAPVTPAPMNASPPFGGFQVVTSAEGPNNCFSTAVWGLLNSAHQVQLGPFQLFHSGSNIALHSVYPIDDGTLTNYYDINGTIDGQNFTMTRPVSAVTSPPCVDGSEDAGTLSESLTGTLSADGKHLDGIFVRAFHFPWGDFTTHWEWTLNQQS